MHSDDWFTECAYRDGVVIEAKDLTFPHHHPAAGKAPIDATYAETNAQERYQQGARVLDRLRHRTI